MIGYFSDVDDSRIILLNLWTCSPKSTVSHLKQAINFNTGVVSIKGTVTKECLRHSLTWRNRRLREYYRVWDEGYLKEILFKQNVIFWVTQSSKHTCTAWCAECLNTCPLLKDILDFLTKTKVTGRLVVSARVFAWNNATLAGRIVLNFFLKFVDTFRFSLKSERNNNLHEQWSILM